MRLVTAVITPIVYTVKVLPYRRTGVITYAVSVRIVRTHGVLYAIELQSIA